MITKLKKIKNLAVFKDFEWDTSIRDGGNNVILCKPINIFYGRNYSGKTTLSRILRALEVGEISEKYENPEFEICFDDTTNIIQSNLSSHNKKIRVFNEDFVKQNLRFIINPEESITPFAILGGNTTIEEEIKELKNQLGEKKEGEESGFYLELKNAIDTEKASSKILKSEVSKLNQQLSYKATNNPDGIKYKSGKFGDQNYTKPKLEKELNQLLTSSFKPLKDDEVSEKLQLLRETSNSTVQPISKPLINIKKLNEKAENLITRPLSSSDKIQQLLKDAILNRWVKEGRQLHNNKLSKCALCGNDISEERWKKLDSHFDEESTKLEKDINSLIQEIDSKVSYLDNQLQINKSFFYSNFHINLDRLINFRNQTIDSIKSELSSVKSKLIERRDDLLNSKNYTPVQDNTKRLEWGWNIFENYRVKANEYTSKLSDEQSKAKNLLRLKEVYDFSKTIQYNEVTKKIEGLKETADSDKQKIEGCEQKIEEQLESIQEKERLMNDEEKGALKVNEYLTNFFGHDFLSLQALENSDQVDGKKIRFEIMRSGKKAHHLSEGECSLISFCYFMAKLEDIETKDSQPIIWIDDPISSLDANHIFFVYSLINSEIVSNQKFGQLFISTHNLDFLKYLKRLPGALNKNKSNYFLVFRENEHSKIMLMPKYLKDYVTEFNFLFHQIYKCANVSEDDESQHDLFYNFGNNARKFLEAFLFYKYPNAVGNDDKLTKFFGNDSQASSMTDRINNEFSHLEGLFERSMVPIDIPEMKKTASYILNKIKEKDIDQYDALLISIGEN